MNEIKFSSYGVWDLLRKVYQNKEELLPKLGFNTYEEFLDWMKTGDQDTQDEFQNIITKHEMEKSTPMTEIKLKQVIKEEIKRILNKDIEEAYQLVNIVPRTSDKDPNRPEREPQDSHIYLKPSTEKLLKKNQHIRILRKPETPDIISGVAIRSTLLEPQNIKRLPYDINSMFKGFLSTANNIGGKITLPTRDTGPEDYTILNNVKIGREGRLSFFVPNPKSKSIDENSDHNKNSMIRGMINMLKRPEIKNASFKELMDLNIAMQQLMPDIQRPDYDSPSNTAAIQAMIDMDKEKGRRPSLDENEDKTDEVVDDLKDEMSSILKALDNELEKKTKTQNEGLLTVAGIALALPAIMGLVAKFGKAAGNTVRKVLGKKPTDKGEYNEWMAKLGGIADDLHHLYMAPIKGIVSKFIKDKTKADKVSSAIFHVIVATFLIISGATAVKALQAKNISLTTLEAALTAVKGGEVQAFITKLVA